MKSLKRIFYVGGVLLATVVALTACKKEKEKNELGEWKISTITLTQPDSDTPAVTIDVNNATATTQSLTAFVNTEFPTLAEVIKPLLSGVALLLPSVANVEFDFEDKGVLKIENLPNKTPDVHGTWTMKDNTVTTNVASFPTDKLENYGVFLGLLAGKDVNFTKNGNTMVHKKNGSELLDLFGTIGGDMGGDAMKSALAALKTKYAGSNVVLTLVKKG